MAASGTKEEGESGWSGNRAPEIVSAAARLFRERGYAGTTVRDIAKAVKVTSGSLFHHFGTKEEILRCVVDEGIRQGIDLIKSERSLQYDPRSRLSAMIHAHLSGLLAGSPESQSVMFYDWWSLSDLSRKGIVKKRDSYEALWDEAISDLEGKASNRNQRRVKRLLLFGAMNRTTQWYRSSGSADFDVVTKTLMDAFFK